MVIRPIARDYTKAGSITALTLLQAMENQLEQLEMEQYWLLVAAVAMLMETGLQSSMTMP